jgi:hypothetical protein
METYLLISVLLFATGLLLVLKEFFNKEIQFIINWPYLIYGIGFPVLLILMETDIFRPFLSKYIYSKDQILIAQVVMLFFVFSSHFIGKFLIKEETIDSLLKKTKGKDMITVDIVNSLGFKVYVLLNFIFFIAIFILAYKSGEIGKVYDFRELPHLKYWGALAFSTENITILILFYIFNLLMYPDKTQRSLFLELLFVAFVALRIFTGSRIFLAKILLAYLIFSFFIGKISLKKIVAISIAGIVFFSIVGFYRLGAGEYLDLSFFSLFYSYFMEAAFNDLTLVIAVMNLKGLVLFPLSLLTVPLFLLPSFLIDKKAIINEFFNKKAFADLAQVDDYSPLGAMSFLADLIIGYGIYFVFILVLLIVAGYFFLRYIKTSMGLFMLFAFSSTVINIWRDSFFISFKIIVEHIFLNIVILFLFYLYFQNCETECRNKPMANNEQTS